MDEPPIYSRQPIKRNRRRAKPTVSKKCSVSAETNSAVISLENKDDERAKEGSHDLEKSDEEASAPTANEAQAPECNKAECCGSGDGNNGLNAAPSGSKDKQKKIKRPMNAFLLWSKSQRPRVVRSHPFACSEYISRQLGIEWNRMSMLEKEPYYREAFKLKKQHEQDFPDWVYNPKRKKIKFANSYVSRPHCRREDTTEGHHEPGGNVAVVQGTSKQDPTLPYPSSSYTIQSAASSYTIEQISVAQQSPKPPDTVNMSSAHHSEEQHPIVLETFSLLDIIPRPDNQPACNTNAQQLQICHLLDDEPQPDKQSFTSSSTTQQLPTIQQAFGIFDKVLLHDLQSTSSNPTAQPLPVVQQTSRFPDTSPHRATMHIFQPLISQSTQNVAAYPNSLWYHSSSSAAGVAAEPASQQLQSSCSPTVISSEFHGSSYMQLAQPVLHCPQLFPRAGLSYPSSIYRSSVAILPPYPMSLPQLYPSRCICCAYPEFSHPMAVYGNPVVVQDPLFSSPNHQYAFREAGLGSRNAAFHEAPAVATMERPTQVDVGYMDDMQRGEQTMTML